MGRRRNSSSSDDGIEFESEENQLDAERRLRKKHNELLLELGAAVPLITNAMASQLKDIIITDAIAYILELQKCAKDLSDQLCEMDAEEPETEHSSEMNHWRIEPEVTVTCIDGKKLWMKMVFERKICGFTKLMEAVSVLGIHFVNANVTTMKGAVLVTSCIEEIHGGGTLAADEVKEHVLEIIKGI